MKPFITFFLLIISIFSFGQIEKNHSYKIVKKDFFFSIEDSFIKHKVDTSRKLTFNNIESINFVDASKYNYNTQAIYWFKFSVTPKVKAKFVTLFFGLADVSNVFIPYKNKYQKFQIGLLSKKKIKIDIVESSSLMVPLDSIDFSKPFYYNQKPISHWGKLTLNYKPIISLTDTKMVINGILYEESFTPAFTTYSSIIFMSFLLFLVSFFITKDVNFLNYSLYLLFTLLMFVPKLPVFYNFLNSINPNLYFYLSQIGLITTSGFYIYFVCSFLEFKTNYPKVFILTKYTLYSIIVFALIYISLLIFVPFFEFRFVLIDSFKVIFTLITLGIFIYLMFCKTDFITKIVLFGSFLLIIGNVLSIIFNYSLYFLNTVLVEILLFSVVVSLKNKINTQAGIKNKLALENELIEKKALLELDKLKVNFFTNISHEFRTPLTMISGPLQSYLQKDNLEKEDKLSFKMMYRNSLRLLSLVDQLLDISKIEAGNVLLKISKNKITPFVGTLADGFTFKANQKEINYLVYNNYTKINTYFDADIVEKIVVNLLSNAVKYTPKQGVIICNATVKNNEFHFTVKNTGKGLSKEELNNIFERFYQVNENNQGAGIGLALVKELTTLHKGTITVESKPNDWTTFKVIIPIDKESFTSNEFHLQETNGELKQEVNLNEVYNGIEYNTDEKEENPILLIVDDNEDIRTYITDLFKNTYNILKAKDGKEGVALAIKNIPDIIISDIMMPVKDGVELCNELKTDERTSHIPIILLTAKAGEENKLEGIKTGADDYITKPFNQEFLQVRVKKLIENRKKLQTRYSQEVILQPKDIAITSVDEHFLKKVQEVLDTTLTDSSFNIEAFSNALAMSRMQLHRKLKALTGLSASGFIRSQRLKLAAELLKKSEINISQIGYSVGFNDHAYFSKCFKKSYKCSPTDYQKKHFIN